MNRLARGLKSAVALLALWLAPAAAHAGGGKAEPCADDARRVGDLGIASLDCDCIFNSRSRSTDGRAVIVHRWTFRSEPRVSEVREDGPAAGRLREGDAITAIDGALITTRDGARRFAGVTPGSVITLTVRREGREIPVRIVADGICPEDAPWPQTGVVVMTPDQPPMAPQTPELTAVPETPEPAEKEAPEAAARAARIANLPKPAIPTEDALPRGWSGFGLTCSNCGGRPGDDGEPPAWEFGTKPAIYFLDPGSPAARAGLQIGDVLTHLDGVSLLTTEGGRRFGALKPGQNVRWTILRAGRTRTVNVITEPRPGEHSIPLAELQERLKTLSENRDAVRMSSEMRRLAREMELANARMSRVAARERLRYAGAVGGSEVEVRGLENVVVDDDGDEIVITTRDATIRIKKAAGTTPTPKPKKP